MRQLIVTCPRRRCRQQMRVFESALGKTGTCVGCGKRVKITQRNTFAAEALTHVTAYAKESRQGVAESGGQEKRTQGGEQTSPSFRASTPSTKDGSKEGVSSKSFAEKDNMGTRHDSYAFANSYWATRLGSRRKDPYVLAVFDTQRDAREALLELPCIHIAEDTGKLICTEMLIFGCYATRVTNEPFHAIICGDELSHELWEQAMASFKKYHGRIKNSLEPEERALSASEATKAPPSKVEFIREDRRSAPLGVTMIYRIHKAPNAASAKMFLKQNPVTQQYHYIIVETPDGNYGRDIQGIYRE